MAEEIDYQKEYGEKCDVGKPIKAIAGTAAGAGIGVIGAVAAITTAAAFEVVLPVALCLWAGGVTFGAVGLMLGIGKKK